MEGGLSSACVVSTHGNFSVNPFDMPVDHVSAKGHVPASTRGPMCYVSGHDVLDPLSLSSCTDSFEYGEKRSQSGTTQSSGSIKAIQQDESFASDALRRGDSCSNSAIADKRSREVFSQQNNYVYKRKKLRHSLTLLSGLAHAAFTKESAQSNPPNSDQLTQEGKIEILLNTEVNARGHCKISTAGPEISQPDKNDVISETDVNDKLDAKKPVSEYQLCKTEKAGNILEKKNICKQQNKSDTTTMDISNYLSQPGKSTLNNGSNQMLNVNCNWNQSRYNLPHEHVNSDTDHRAHYNICTAGPEVLHPRNNKIISETDVNDKLDAVKPVCEYQICNIEKAGNIIEREEICKQDNERDICTMEISNYPFQPGKTTLNSGSNQVLNVNCNGNRSRYLFPYEESNSTSQSESSSFPYNFERKLGSQEFCVEATCTSRSDSGSFTTFSYQVMNNNQDKLSKAGDEFGYCISDAERVAEGRDLEREWCISILNEYKLLLVSPGISAATEHPGFVGDGRWNKKCKLCYSSENSNSTLICDMCEESFHMACCNPKVVSIPDDDNWYCPACRKKRKRLVVREGLSWHETRENRHVLRFPPRGIVKAGCENFVKEKNGRFWCMFQDNEAYATQVRIGKDYQANVPVWTGKVMNFAESPFMGELVYSEEKLLELELTEHSLKTGMQQKDWKPTKCLTPSSRENWLQCQNVHFREGDILPDGRKAKKDIICGKWRRAPVTEVQTDEWDCSCAVVWDSLHADCAVPQELETEDIMERLKASTKVFELHVDLHTGENDKHQEQRTQLDRVKVGAQANKALVLNPSTGHTRIGAFDTMSMFGTLTSPPQRIPVLVVQPEAEAAAGTIEIATTPPVVEAVQLAAEPVEAPPAAREIGDEATTAQSSGQIHPEIAEVGSLLSSRFHFPSEVSIPPMSPWRQAPQCSPPPEHQIVQVGSMPEREATSTPPQVDEEPGDPLRVHQQSAPPQLAGDWADLIERARHMAVVAQGKEEAARLEGRRELDIELEALVQFVQTGCEEEFRAKERDGWQLQELLAATEIQDMSHIQDIAHYNLGMVEQAYRRKFYELQRYEVEKEQLEEQAQQATVCQRKLEQQLAQLQETLERERKEKEALEEASQKRELELLKAAKFLKRARELYVIADEHLRQRTEEVYRLRAQHGASSSRSPPPASGMHPPTS